MILIAHQQGHTVDEADGGGGATGGSKLMLMGVGRAIILGLLFTVTGGTQWI